MKICYYLPGNFILQFTYKRTKKSIYIKINVNLSVFYTFLNHSTNCNCIWYRDRLDLWEEDRLIYKKRPIKIGV